jgi:hypothetical protein
MIDPPKLREFRMRQQCIDGNEGPQSLITTLLFCSGWIRGVGSVTPYFHLNSRGGYSREQVDQSLANLEIQELPAVRGCTYIVPKECFALALALAHFPGDEFKLGAGERRLGFTEEKLNNLESQVLSVLYYGDADPRQLRNELGDKVTSFGEEGKKYGLSSDLPTVLQRLQLKGKIRRVPKNGRLDNETYNYAVWRNNPLDGFSMTKAELQAQLAEMYAQWISPFTIEEFQWFSGFSKRDALAALGQEKTLRCQDEHYIHTDLVEIFENLQSDPTPNPQFLTCLDNLIMLTRNLALHIDKADRPLVAKIEGKEIPKGSLFDLDNHPIFDRGRLVGLWAFDQPNQELVYTAWGSDKDLITQRAAETEAFIKEQLGDARSFSMDSTKSRQPRINLLREQPNYHG